MEEGWVTRSQMERKVENVPGSGKECLEAGRWQQGIQIEEKTPTYLLQIDVCIRNIGEYVLLFQNSGFYIQVVDFIFECSLNRNQNKEGLLLI